MKSVVIVNRCPILLLLVNLVYLQSWTSTVDSINLLPVLVLDFNVCQGSARQNESLFRSNGTHVFVLLGFRSDGISFQRDRALQRAAY